MPIEPLQCRAGISLVELVVALVIVELAAIILLSALMTAIRVNRDLDLGSREDLRRRKAVSEAVLSSSCTAPAIPWLLPLIFPSTANRPRATALIRCGE